MTGIDTNVLIRFYIRDDEQQYQKARKLLEQADLNSPLFVNHIVIIEWVWVLEQVYNIPKKKIISEFEFLLKSKEIFVENIEIINDALYLFKKQNIEFADCLIAVLNKNNGCNNTFTFDKKASRLPYFTYLK